LHLQNDKQLENLAGRDDSSLLRVCQVEKTSSRSLEDVGDVKGAEELISV
jgi:hypothetical protein